jgi:hypothetical protein
MWRVAWCSGDYGANNRKISLKSLLEISVEWDFFPADKSQNGSLTSSMLNGSDPGTQRCTYNTNNTIAFSGTISWLLSPISTPTSTQLLIWSFFSNRDASKIYWVLLYFWDLLARSKRASRIMIYFLTVAMWRSSFASLSATKEVFSNQRRGALRPPSPYVALINQ